MQLRRLRPRGAAVDGVDVDDVHVAADGERGDNAEVK